MADRYYLPEALALGPISAHGTEAHHLAAVCRVRPGDQIFLFNGDGHEYRARVVAVARRKVDLMIEEVGSPQRELGFHLEVACPLPKGDRGQFLVEKLTELGATRYIPLKTRRSVIHPGEGRLEKLERHVIEAAKQCGRNVLMEVDPTADWPIYSRRIDLPGLRFLAHPTSGNSRSTLSSVSSGRAVAIGPEGGFTDDEIELGRQNGWHLVDLGPRILRMETAAVVLAAWAGRIVPDLIALEDS